MRPDAPRTRGNWLRSILTATWAVCVQLFCGVHFIVQTILITLFSIQRYNPLAIIIERRGRLSALDCHGNQLYRPTFQKQVYDIFASDHKLKQNLLKWLADVIPQFKITNFHTCWNDGIALCALLETICPGICPHYSFLQNHCRVNNCRLALRLANDYFNVPNSLISAEEIAIADEFNGAENIYRLVHMVKLASEYLQYQMTIKDSHSFEMFDTASRQFCVVDGKGISHGTVGRKSEFTISLPKKCPPYLKINILAPTTRPSGAISEQAAAMTDLEEGLHYGSNVTKRHISFLAGNNKDNDVNIKSCSAFEMLPFDYKILPGGNALVSYVPRNSGFHYVRVRVDEQDVNGSPFRVLITHPTLTYQDSRSTFKRSLSLEPSWTVIENDKKITVKKKRILRRTLIPRVLKDGRRESKTANEGQKKDRLTDKICEETLDISPAVSLALRGFQDGARKGPRAHSHGFKTYREEQEEWGLGDEDIAINFRPIKSHDLHSLAKRGDKSINKRNSDNCQSKLSSLVDGNSESNFEYLTPGSSPCPLISEDDNSSSVYFDAMNKSYQKTAMESLDSRRSHQGEIKYKLGVSKSDSRENFFVKDQRGKYTARCVGNVMGEETPPNEPSKEEESKRGVKETEENKDGEKEEEGREKDYEQQETRGGGGGGGRRRETDDDEEEAEEEEGEEEGEEEEGEEEGEEEEEDEEEEEEEEERESEEKVYSKSKKRLSQRAGAPFKFRRRRLPISILKNGLKSKRSAFSSVKRTSPKLTSPHTSDVSHDSLSEEVFLSYPLARRHRDSLIKNKECFTSFNLKRSTSFRCEHDSMAQRPPQGSRRFHNNHMSYNELMSIQQNEESESQRRKNQECQTEEKSDDMHSSPQHSQITTHYRSDDSDSSSISLPRNIYRTKTGKMDFSSNRHSKLAPSDRVTPWSMKTKENEKRPELSYEPHVHSDAEENSLYAENRMYDIGFEEYNRMDSMTYENCSYSADHQHPQCSTSKLPQSPGAYDFTPNSWKTDMNYNDSYYDERGHFPDASFPFWRNVPISCGSIRNRTRKCSCQKSESNWIPVSNKDILRLQVCRECHNSVGSRSIGANRRPNEMSPTSSMSPTIDLFNNPISFNIPNYPMYSRDGIVAPSPTETTRSDGTETYKSEIQIMVKSPRREKSVTNESTKVEASAKKRNSVILKKSKLLVLHNYSLPEDRDKGGNSGKDARSGQVLHNTATSQSNIPAIILDAKEKELGSKSCARHQQQEDNLENQRFVRGWLNDYIELPARQSTMEAIDSGIAIDSRSSSPQRPATLGGQDPPSSVPRAVNSHPPPLNAEMSYVSNRSYRHQNHSEQLEEYTNHFFQKQRIRQLEKEQKYMNIRPLQNLPEGRSESSPCTVQQVHYHAKPNSLENNVRYLPHHHLKSPRYTECSYDPRSSPTNDGYSYDRMHRSSTTSSGNWTEREVNKRGFLPQLRQFGTGGLLQAIIKPFEESKARKAVNDSNEDTSDMDFWSSGGYHETGKTDEDSQFLTASYGGRDSNRSTLSNNFKKSNCSTNKSSKENDNDDNVDYDDRRRRYYDEQIGFVPLSGEPSAHHLRRHRQFYYNEPLTQSRPHYSSVNSLFTEGGTSTPPMHFNSCPAQLTSDRYVSKNDKYKSKNPNHFSGEPLFRYGRPGDRCIQRPKKRQEPLGFRSSLRQYRSYASGLNELLITDNDDGPPAQTTTSAVSSLSSDKNLYAQYLDRSDATDFSSLMEMEEFPSTSEAVINEVHGYRSDNPENLSPAGSLLINEIKYEEDEEFAPWFNQHTDYSSNSNGTDPNFSANRKMPSAASDHMDYYRRDSIDSHPKRCLPNVNLKEAPGICCSGCRGDACYSDSCIDPVIQCRHPHIGNCASTSEALVPGTEMLFYSLHKAIVNVEERPLNECYALGPGLDNGYVHVINFFQVRTVNGHGPLTVGIRGPRTNNTVLETSVIYSEDSVYDVTYRVSTPGCYTIDVKWAGSHIHQSPFICKVMP